MSVFVRQIGRKEKSESLVFPHRQETPIHQSQSLKSDKAIRRESRITLGGLVYIAVTMFLAIGAINSQNNLLFWLFGVAIATLIVSGLFSGNALMQIRLEAQEVPDSAAGEKIRIHYVLTNRSKIFPLFAALITEVPQDDHHRADRTPASVIHLGPRQQQKFSGSIVEAHRGRYALNRIRLSTRFPFGLLQKSLIFESHRAYTVMPFELDLNPEVYRVQRGRGEEAKKRSTRSGVSNEYWGLREYAHGDPKRSIAWKQSAKNQRLVVIQKTQPLSSRLWVWVRADQIDGNREYSASETILIERAVALAASVVSQASSRGVPVGLWMPGFDIRISPSNTRAHRSRCLRTLALIDLTSDRQTDLPPPASEADDVIQVFYQDTTRSDVQSGKRTYFAVRPEQWMASGQHLPHALDLADKIEKKDSSDLVKSGSRSFSNKPPELSVSHHDDLRGGRLR
jgi:uncharacterized protein (DUF58 family)